MSALRANETKITTENAFNPDPIGMEGKHKSEKEAKTFFWVFLLIHGRFVSSWAAKDVCPSIV